MLQKNTVSQQTPEELLHRLYAIHGGITRHMELVNEAKKVELMDSKIAIKVRWFKLNSILLNFGLIKQSKISQDYSLCCYKCNQIIFVASFSTLDVHLKSSKHI